METRDSFNELLLRVTNHMTESIGFVNTYMKDRNGQGYKKATVVNYMQILAGEKLWNDYAFHQRDIINGFGLTQNCKSYEALVKEARSLKLKAEKFLERFVYGEHKEPQYTLTADNFLRVLQGVNVWNTLSSEERKGIHTMLSYHQGESFPMLYERAMHVKKAAETFIASYMKVADGLRFTMVDNSNYLIILSGEKAWKEKPVLIQKAIDHMMNHPVYEQLLNGAVMLMDTTRQFIENFVSDQNGALFEVVTKENCSLILKGKITWKRMTKNQRVIINEMLKAQGCKQYDDLLDDARVLQYEFQM